jgi:hypothetical protein
MRRRHRQSRQKYRSRSRKWTRLDSKVDRVYRVRRLQFQPDEMVAAKWNRRRRLFD